MGSLYVERSLNCDQFNTFHRNSVQLSSNLPPSHYASISMTQLFNSDGAQPSFGSYDNGSCFNEIRSRILPRYAHASQRLQRDNEESSYFNHFSVVLTEMFDFIIAMSSYRSCLYGWIRKGSCFSSNWHSMKILFISTFNICNPSQVLGASSLYFWVATLTAYSVPTSKQHRTGERFKAESKLNLFMSHSSVRLKSFRSRLTNIHCVVTFPFINISK